MENVFAALLHPVLVDAGELNGFRFQRHIASLHQILDQRFEYGVGRYALRQQLVQSFANLFQFGRCLLEQNLVGRFAQKHLPIQFGDLLVGREWILLGSCRFQQ